MIRIVTEFADSCGRALRTIRRVRKCVCDWGIISKVTNDSIYHKIYEPRHAIMCLREINYVMRYDVVKSGVIISRRA